MKKPNLKQKLSYWFDNLMSKGTLSLIFVLAVITILVVFITGIVVSISDPEANGNIFQAAWMSLMHALDAGTIAGDDTSNILFIGLSSSNSFIFSSSFCFLNSAFA